jgi:hypothetical protein
MRFMLALLGASSMLALAGHALAADAAPTSNSQNQAFELGEVIVTAPKVRGVQIDTSTLTAVTLQAYDVPRLDQAIDLLPGVNSSSTGGTRNERLIQVRGFNRFEAPLLIDGIRVYLPADNRLDFGRFLTSDIAEVQVAKGYVSVLDGPGGMGGEINLVTSKPVKPLEFQMGGEADFGNRSDFDLHHLQPARHAPGQVVRPGQRHRRQGGSLGPVQGLHARRGPAGRSEAAVRDRRLAGQSQGRLHAQRHRRVFDQLYLSGWNQGCAIQRRLAHCEPEILDLALLGSR